MGTEALVIATIASAAISAAGAIHTGNVNSATAKDRAKQAEISGQMSLLSARQKAAKLTGDKNALKARQVAQAAKGGMDTGSKSLIDIQRTTDKKAADDIEAIMSAGRMSLATSQATSSSYNNQAGGYMTAGFLDAGSSILSGATKAYSISQWDGFADNPSKP